MNGNIARFIGFTFLLLQTTLASFPATTHAASNQDETDIAQVLNWRLDLRASEEYLSVSMCDLKSPVAKISTRDTKLEVAQSSACTCLCKCQQCTVKNSCYQPKLCGSCAKQCEEVCQNHNCGMVVEATGDCP